MKATRQMKKMAKPGRHHKGHDQHGLKVDGTKTKKAKAWWAGPPYVMTKDRGVVSTIYGSKQ